MNAYKLDDRTMDKSFLSGDPIWCDVVLPIADQNSAMLEKGQKIVVLLSTGKKYMGEVVNFDFMRLNKHIKGKLEIIRYPKVK